MKGLNLLMSMLAILCAGLSAMFYFAIGNDRDRFERERNEAQVQLASAQQRAADAGTERDGVVGRITVMEKELSELKARNTTLEARNSQLSREITRARDELTQREQSQSGVQEELSGLRRQLADARSSLAASMGGASPEQVAAYEARIRDLEMQLAEARRMTDPAVIFAAVPSDLTGNVVEVGPKSAFVVLNIGTRDGAVNSLEMTLRRGSTVIGRIKLTDVRETYSVAQVLPESGTGNIRTGDVASRS